MRQLISSAVIRMGGEAPIVAGSDDEDGGREAREGKQHQLKIRVGWARV
jgi:hypothetical protein